MRTQPLLASAVLLLLALAGCSSDVVAPGASDPGTDAAAPAQGCNDEYLRVGEAWATELPAAVSVPSLPSATCLVVKSFTGNGTPEYLASSSGTWEIYRGLFAIAAEEAIFGLVADGFVVAENDSSYFTAPAAAWDPFFAGSPASTVTVGAVQAHAGPEALLDTAVEFYGVEPGTYSELEFQVKVAD